MRTYLHTSYCTLMHMSYTHYTTYRPRHAPLYDTILTRIHTSFIRSFLDLLAPPHLCFRLFLALHLPDSIVWCMYTHIELSGFEFAPTCRIIQGLCLGSVLLHFRIVLIYMIIYILAPPVGFLTFWFRFIRQRIFLLRC